jgi:uncharacterized protein YqjF (DUF2071 family)
MPGVWFFSLDAANPIAVELARDFFHLNYYTARMQCIRRGDSVEYTSVRRHRGAPPAALTASYRPTGSVYQARPGSLDTFLTDRYCLYMANRRGRVGRGEIHHDPWSLQPAEVELQHNTMTRQIGLDLPLSRPILHFAQRVDMVAWAPAWVTPS